MINDGDFSAYASSSSFLLVCNLMMRLNCSKITQGFPDGHWGRMTIYVRSAPEPLFSTWDVGNYGGNAADQRKKSVHLHVLNYLELGLPATLNSLL